MGKYIQTKGSKISTDAPSAKAFRFFYDALAKGVDLAGKIEVRHAGKCGRCAKKLTTPQSVDTGIGPECAKLMGIPYGKDGSGLSFDTEAFIHAGKAFLTLTSVKSGVSFTYRVSKKKDDDTSPLFVSVLNGADNWQNYAYLGIIVDAPKPVQKDKDQLPLPMTPFVLKEEE
jgi:hypothetical protein